MNLETFYEVKEANHKRPIYYIVPFTLNVQNGQSTEAGNRLVVARRWEEMGVGSDC
jgi:hypothetical protein